MEHILSVQYNTDSKLYDVVVTDSKYRVIYEVICSCKSFENAQWILEMIEKEKKYV